MPVLPRPCLCIVGRPAADKVSERISPNTYDSVNRFEPTTSGAAPDPCEAGAASHTDADTPRPTSTARRNTPTGRSALLGPSFRVASLTLSHPVLPTRAPSVPSLAARPSPIEAGADPWPS